MALVSASKNCFTAFNAALEAVQKNDAKGAAIILHSVRKDSKLLETEARRLHEQLRRVEQENETRVQNLTREINNLFKEEEQLEEEERNLKIKIPSLKADREHHQQSRNEAQRRYEDAKDKQRIAEIKFKEFKSLWWVPIYGQALLVREIIENNQQRANDEERDKNSHERDIENAGSEIRATNDKINQVHCRIDTIRERLDKKREERERSHMALGKNKNMMVTVMEAVSFAEELISLTGDASLKTGYLERIMKMAAKRKIDIHQTRGIKTAVASFEDSWMKIIEMMSSNQISIVNGNNIHSLTDAKGKIIIYIFIIIIIIYLFTYKKLFFFLLCSVFFFLKLHFG